MTEPAADPAAEFRQFLTAWLASGDHSQYRLGTAAGIGQSIISRWLSPDMYRQTTPSPETLRKLAPVVGLPHHELMRMCGYAVEPPKAGAIDEVIEPELASLLSDLKRGWRQADETTRKIGQDVVRTVFHVSRPRRARNTSEHQLGSDEGQDRPKNDTSMKHVHASLTVTRTIAA